MQLATVGHDVLVFRAKIYIACYKNDWEIKIAIQVMWKKNMWGYNFELGNRQQTILLNIWCKDVASSN